MDFKVLTNSLFRLKCEYLGIDIQDDMGRHEVGFVENTIKTPIGAEEEGCLFEARFHINKVRFMFAFPNYRCFKEKSEKLFSIHLKHLSVRILCWCYDHAFCNNNSSNIEKIS